MSREKTVPSLVITHVCRETAEQIVEIVRQLLTSFRVRTKSELNQSHKEIVYAAVQIYRPMI